MKAFSVGLIATQVTALLNLKSLSVNICDKSNGCTMKDELKSIQQNLAGFLSKLKESTLNDEDTEILQGINTDNYDGCMMPCLGADTMSYILYHNACASSDS